MFQKYNLENGVKLFLFFNFLEVTSNVDNFIGEISRQGNIWVERGTMTPKSPLKPQNRFFCTSIPLFGARSQIFFVIVKKILLIDTTI